MRYLKVFIIFTLGWCCFCQNALAVGDCDSNGTVTISEVQSAINMFLGLKETISCVDEDLSESVTISEVQKTINAYLGLIPLNTSPVANAGTAQNVFTGAFVTLDGSGSSDANGDLLTYSWAFTSKPVGSTAALSSAIIAKPTFIPDVAGAYIFNLLVNDGKADSTTATVTVNATESYLQLSQTNSFFGTTIILSMPYTTTATSNQNLVGIPAPTYATVDTFTLKAIGRNFTINNLSAVDSTGRVVPYFDGLSDGQTITAGTSVTFSLRSPLTRNNTVDLSYKFTVAETTNTFTYNVSLRTN